MSKRIEFETITAFGLAIAEIRCQFPEFAEEIDRLQYDIGQKTIAPCEHEKCGCKISFKDFHDARNRFFSTRREAQNNEFIKKQ